ncbi:MAG TPA: rhomboid family intramembrane serine protease [Rhodothermia bacterium]|nr:rhomboid family intramembrane serine protease [Rhodothermia bacterium]
MIPIRDVNPRRTAPIVNIVLILINVLAFFWEVSLGERITGALASIAFIPARFWQPGDIVPDTMSMFVSMFLHGGWMHLGGNMLYLWIFGDNIEDRLGHVRYLIFYLVCGIAATFAHAFVNPASALPAVGASGAIAGVLGGYLLLFPRARVMTVIPFGFYMAMRELPAIFVLGLWFVMQLFTGAASMGARSLEEAGGVAYFAHIGGFVAGLVLVKLMAKPLREAPMALQKF